MTHILALIGYGLLSVAIVTASQPASGSPRKTPKGTVLCLPPGSTTPRPCAQLAAGSMMVFRADSDFEGATILRFRPRAVGLEGKQYDVPLASATLRRGQNYRFQLPRQLCEGTARAERGQSLQFEIQILTSDMQNAESDHASVGLFQQQTGTAWRGTLQCSAQR